jgi:hypothetical protein
LFYSTSLVLNRNGCCSSSGNTTTLVHLTHRWTYAHQHTKEHLLFLLGQSYIYVYIYIQRMALPLGRIQTLLVKRKVRLMLVKFLVTYSETMTERTNERKEKKRKEIFCGKNHHHNFTVSSLRLVLLFSLSTLVFVERALLFIIENELVCFRDLRLFCLYA